MSTRTEVATYPFTLEPGRLVSWIDETGERRFGLFRGYTLVGPHYVAPLELSGPAVPVSDLDIAPDPFVVDGIWEQNR